MTIAPERPSGPSQEATGQDKESEEFTNVINAAYALEQLLFAQGLGEGVLAVVGRNVEIACRGLTQEEKERANTLAMGLRAGRYTNL